jgi:hypothetical protein
VREDSIFLIDGFDEAHRNNQLIDDLILEKVLSRTTVLIASRPGYLQHHSEQFDSLLTVCDLPREQQMQLISNFSDEVQLPASRSGQLEALPDSEHREL